MILLDTNVLSELMRAEPEAAVERWLAAQPAAGVFISSVTEVELRYGLRLLPDGKRRLSLTSMVEGMLAEDFKGRILPFDSPAAIAFAEIAAERRRVGKPISQADAQIAAIARSRGAAVATRNVGDFTGCGIEVIDPWSDTRP